jgi:alanyl-tRNA synthetase
MNTADLRKAFLSFFAERGHEVVASSSILTENDPTLLFCIAGMNQFKGLFLGAEKRSYNKAVTSQKCIRISGKHNDFENVGMTARHHTFFEMLGNFSFGDYFKTEAIEYAWKFITETLKLSKDRLWITVFETDDEAAELWQKKAGVAADRILRLGEKDNFWAMGDTGPCGPCSEIHYYLGDDLSVQSGEDFLKEDGRYVEIWNLVFMQYDRSKDGTLTPLPNPCIDTGMGLERVAAIVQGKRANYDADIFRSIISCVEELSAHEYDGASYEQRDLGSDEGYARDVAMRVIADHSRTAAFMVAAGVTPSSDGRGYILRRVLRRAVRHGRKLGFKEPFLKTTTAKVVQLMGEAYPELVERADLIQRVVNAEEVKFYETLDSGLAILQKEAQTVLKSHTGQQTQLFPGRIAFQLHDTFGFPLDLTEDALKEFGLVVDADEFTACMQAQRERSRSDRKDAGIVFAAQSVSCAPTQFVGYESLQSAATLIELQSDNNGSYCLFFDRTPFYGESGGQVGDQGRIKFGGAIFEVLDVQKLHGTHFAHYCVLSDGDASGVVEGAHAELEVSQSRRGRIEKNHSATHLLHEALQSVLGSHVKQAGSKVDDELLRFDFSHFEAVTDAEIATIQRKMNEHVWANHEVVTKEMDVNAAKASGATALFGEKYGDVVRVVTIGAGSVELCGGTHVKRSGDIGSIVLLSEGGVSAGVRRIECITGERAFERMVAEKSERKQLAGLLKADASQLIDRVERLIEKNRELEREVEQLKAKDASSRSGAMVSDAITGKGGVNVVAKVVDAVDVATLKSMVDALRVQIGSGVVALASSGDGGGMLVAGVTSDLTSTLNAGSLVKEASAIAGGKGGGRADFAQAGGIASDKISAVIEKFVSLVS